MDCDLNLERLFDEHFGTDVAEEEMDNAEDGDGAEASDIVDTQIGGYLNLPQLEWEKENEWMDGSGGWHNSGVVGQRGLGIGGRPTMTVIPDYIKRDQCKRLYPSDRSTE